MTRPDWMTDAACREVGTDLFFPGRGESAAYAKEVCSRCTVRDECLSWALEHEVDDGLHLVAKGPYGVFGEMTGDERRELVRAMRKAAS